MLTQKLPFLINLATYLTKNDKQVVYIAGKVTGLPVLEYKAKFEAAQRKLEAQGFKVLNPCEFIGPSESWETAMRMASTLLNMSDHIYLLPDWGESRGARFEFYQATKFGINVMSVE